MLQDSADLPRLALLLVLQAHGQPSAGKLTEMKRRERTKNGLSCEVGVAFACCFQMLPGQHLHSQVCDIHIHHISIIFIFIPMLYCEEQARDLSKS